MQIIKSNYLALSTTMVMCLSLISCGGGSSGNRIVEGGISGTGITMGRITKFGSIYVNGVRFNIDKATFQRDGLVSKGQEEFSIGEYIVIKGSVDASKLSGVATEVIFEDVLEGAVTLASSNNISLEVLGQMIKTDNITAIYGVKKLNELLVGNIVEVSGFKDAAGVIQATSIKLKQNEFIVGISENELKGTVSLHSQSSKTFMLGSIMVDYGSANLENFNGSVLDNGQFVEVKSNSPIIGNLLIAKEIELKNKNSSISSNIKLEIEGVVTRFISSKDFDVNGVMVTTHAQTKYKKGFESDLALNSTVEIEGIVNSASVLVADEIKFETEEESESSENPSESESEEQGSEEEGSEEEKENEEED